MENQKTTGRPVALRTNRFRLVLDPEHGGIVRRWDLVDAETVLPLFRPMADGATAPLDAACFPLVPWCNRIGAAAFVFEGRSYALRRNFPPEPHAIHGEGWLNPWSVREQTADSATLVFEHADTSAARGGWPWPYRAVQAMSLDDAGLTVRLAVTNQGTTAMPVGLGLHPYFPKLPSARLTARLQRMWRNGPDMLPVDTVPAGPASAMDLQDRTLDNCFDGWDGHAVLDLHNGRIRLAIDADDTFGHLVVFVPPGEDYFCVEPVSQANNAVNLARSGRDCTGLRVLQPGETLRGTVRFLA